MNRFAALEDLDSDEHLTFSLPDSDHESLSSDQDSVSSYIDSDTFRDSRSHASVTQYDYDEESEDGDCNAVSDTSTEEYVQECFEDFQHKVVALCEHLWPDEQGNISVERLGGGSYNRIVGITIAAEPYAASKISFSQTFWSPSKLFARFKKLIRMPAKNKEPANYILRTPRENEDHSNIAREIALFRLANKSLPSFTVPTAVKFDVTCENPLGAPFVISERVPGVDLDDLWQDLNQQQKMSLGIQIGRLYKELSQNYFKYAGTVDPTSVSNVKGEKENIRVLEHEFSRRTRINNEVKNITENPHTLASRQTPLQVLRSRFQKWKVWDFHPNFPDGESIPYTKLLRIVEEQQTEHSTWSPKRRFYLAHNDLYPRNIMARIVNDHKVEVTGILDWDLATIAPAVVAFQPPWWLWRNEQYQAEASDWSDAVRVSKHYEAVTPEEKQIRAAFEARAGIEVTKHTKNPDSHLARKLWEWACRGFPRSEQIDFARDVVDQWEAGKE